MCSLWQLFLKCVFLAYQGPQWPSSHESLILWGDISVWLRSNEDSESEESVSVSRDLRTAFIQVAGLLSIQTGELFKILIFLLQSKEKETQDASSVSVRPSAASVIVRVVFIATLLICYKMYLYMHLYKSMTLQI